MPTLTNLQADILHALPRSDAWGLQTVAECIVSDHDYRPLNADMRAAVKELVRLDLVEELPAAAHTFQLRYRLTERGKKWADNANGWRPATDVNNDSQRRSY
jgi:hypothetical protein